MSKSSKKKAYQLGHIAEYIAMMMLICKGYTIIAKRYRCPKGEIDIIARKNHAYIFCEVKARRDYITAVESLSEKQKRRVLDSASWYMNGLNIKIDHKKCEEHLYRCDMILIIPWRLPIHIKNAWW
jgi:putative endonuclease